MKKSKVVLIVKNKEVSFEDLGNGLVKDNNGNRFYLVVNRPDGGYLRGNDNQSFKFPK